MHPKSVSLPVSLVGYLDAVLTRAEQVVAAPRGRFRSPPSLDGAYSPAHGAVQLLNGTSGAPRWAVDGFGELYRVVVRPAEGRATAIQRAEELLEIGDRLRGQLVVRMPGHPIRLPLSADELARLGSAPPAQAAMAEAGALQLTLLRQMSAAADPGQAVRDHFATFVARDPDDLSPGEWRHLHELVTMPHTAEHLPPLPNPGRAYRPMTEVLGDLAEGTFRPQGGTRRMFVLLQEQLAGGAPQPQQAAAQLRELVMGSSARAKTGLEWARIQRLLELVPKELQPPRGSYRDARPMRRLIAQLVESDIVAGTGTTRQLDRWRNAIDPTYLERRERQLADGVRRGVLDPSLGPDDVLDDAPFWQRLDVDRPTLESLQRRAQLLAWANEVPSTKVHTASVLDAIDPRLTQLQPRDDAMRQLLEDTRDLLDRNRRRLAGESLPTDAIRGYGRHPDYAEVGRLTQNVKLLARMAWPDLPGASAPQRASAATEVAGMARASEELAW